MTDSGLGPAHLTLAEVLAQPHDAPALVALFGDWVLVGPSEREGEDAWSYRTLSGRRIRSTDGQVIAFLERSFLARAIKKQNVGPFANTILVGRSRTNDICVMHQSVSKLHARIQVTPDGLMLSDAGSSNGTSLGGTLLPEGTTGRILHGSHISFGQCAYQAFESSRFVELLRKLEIG